MTIHLNTQGNLYSTLDCPHCNKTGPHDLYERLISGDVFQCGRCFAMFTDSSPAPPTWLPSQQGKGV